MIYTGMISIPSAHVANAVFLVTNPMTSYARGKDQKVIKK